ncbi:T9SS type A sorting domain-containing protein [bacterium]|nr:T9SS type A sorting domain-containing protein [bacterium]
MNIKKYIFLIFSVFIMSNFVFAQGGGDLTDDTDSNIFSTAHFEEETKVQAFDGSLDTGNENRWSSFNEVPNQFIGYDFGTFQIINWYGILTDAADDYMPASWVFEGDGESGDPAPGTYTLLDSQNNQDLPSNASGMTYFQVPSNTIAYQRYRIRVSAVKPVGLDYVEINEIEMGYDSSLPVTLSSFSVKQQGNHILIEWATESEENHMGFILERAFATSPEIFETIASYVTHEDLAGQGNSSELREYVVTDEAIQTGLSYLYRLSEVDGEGTVSVLDVIDLDTEATPEKTVLEPPFPNPFNPSTKIRFRMAEEARVEITVFDLMGRKVCTITSGELHSAGNYFKYWNGQDDSGARVPSGAYLIQLKAGDVVRVQKAILTK